LYDPATGEWRVTAGTFRNAASTATLPDSGEVLLIAISAAALYDPSTETWTAAASLNPGRSYHMATLLQNGQVLVVGRYDYTSQGTIVLASARLYKP
jgi:hypothetical protein